MSKNTIDPVITKVWTDENGNEITSFISNPDYVKKTSWWETIKSWFISHDVEVYVGTQDLNNSKEEPGINKPKPAVEVGIKIGF